MRRLARRRFRNQDCAPSASACPVMASTAGSRGCAWSPKEASAGSRRHEWIRRKAGVGSGPIRAMKASVGTSRLGPGCGSARRLDRRRHRGSSGPSAEVSASPPRRPLLCLKPTRTWLALGQIDRQPVRAAEFCSAARCSTVVRAPGEKAAGWAVGRGAAGTGVAPPAGRGIPGAVFVPWMGRWSRSSSHNILTTTSHCRTSPIRSPSDRPGAGSTATADYRSASS